GAATLLGAGGLRRARRVAGTDGGARSVRGILGAGARLPLPGVAALAVSVLADARLRGRSRTRRAALCQRRTRGCALVHPRRGRRRAARRLGAGGTAAVAVDLDLALADRTLARGRLSPSRRSAGIESKHVFDPVRGSRRAGAGAPGALVRRRGARRRLVSRAAALARPPLPRRRRLAWQLGPVAGAAAGAAGGRPAAVGAGRPRIRPAGAAVRRGHGVLRMGAA